MLQGNFRVDQCRIVLTHPDPGASLPGFEVYPSMNSVTMDKITFNLSLKNGDMNCAFHSGYLCRPVRTVPGTE